MTLRNRNILRSSLPGLIVGLAPLPAAAHAFGVRYDLPLPMWLYIGGAGAVVLLTFLILLLFVRKDQGRPEDLRIYITDVPGLSWLSGPVVIRALEVISLLLLALVTATALFGIDDPFDNFAPLFVWVLWWVGLAFFSALFGNIWALVNPWRIIYRKASFLLPRSGRGFTSYPGWLAHWPAVIMFFVFAWMELISDTGEAPSVLGWLIIIYSLSSWLGMLIFGERAWSHQADAFNLAFGLISRFAPFAGKDDRLWLRIPSTGLLSSQQLSPSLIVFVCLLMATVTFDGILEIPLWQQFLEWVAESQALRPHLLALQDWGFDLLVVIKSAALIILALTFFSVFLIFAWSMARAGGRKDAMIIAGWFILTLVPIAIAYHLSHYLSYLLIAGQQVIPLASDPFGWGWDLFNSKSYHVNIGIVNAEIIWYVSVSTIVLGHIFSLFIAHITAFRVFDTSRAAILSQVPMMVVMVGYTMLSLWILSQPIVA